MYAYPNDVSDPSAATSYVDEAFASCIRQVQFDFWDEKKKLGTIQGIINKHFPKGALSGNERFKRLEAIVTEFQRTPRLPTFVQNEDWSYCCGDCAFIEVDFAGDCFE